MNKTLHKIELFVDWVIPYTLLVLFGMIIAEAAYHEQVKPYELYIDILDYTIISIFIIDLIFKYMKLRNIPLFLKKHWLEVLSIFPFYLLFRVFEGVYLSAGLSRLIEQPQALLHGGIEVSETELRLIKEAESAGKISRTGIFLKLIKPLQRLPRFLKVIPYFEKPTEKHHAIISSTSKKHKKKGHK
jgi:hypothetical protein